jgi:hypothetical protein
MLLEALETAGLIAVCDDCSAETLGTILHNAPGHTRQEIDAALFATEGLGH